MIESRGWERLCHVCNECTCQDRVLQRTDTMMSQVSESASEIMSEAKKMRRTLEDVMKNSGRVIELVYSKPEQAKNMATRAEHWRRQHKSAIVVHPAGIGSQKRRNYDGKKGTDGAHGSRGKDATEAGQDGQDGGDAFEGHDGENGHDADEFDLRLQIEKHDKGVRTCLLETVDASDRSTKGTLEIPWTEETLIVIDGTGGRGGDGGKGGNGGGDRE